MFCYHWQLQVSNKCDNCKELTHRNTGQLRLKGTSGGLWTNLLAQVTISIYFTAGYAAFFFWSGLKHLQEQRSHNLLGQPIPIAACPAPELHSSELIL